MFFVLFVKHLVLVTVVDKMLGDQRKCHSHSAPEHCNSF